MTEQTDTTLQRIGELIRSQKFEEAVELLRGASERDPDNAGLLVALGDVLARLGRTIPARRCYQRALAREPGNADARVQLARMLAAHGSTTEAIEHYRQAIKWHADVTPAYTELAALLARTGDDQGAIDLLSRVAERAPDSADALLNLGDILMPARRFAEAEACFRRLLQRSPQNPELLTRLGASLAGQERLDEAFASFAQAAQAAPDLPEAAHGLARIHWARGERTEALAVLREFLAQRASDAAMHHEFAVRLDLMGQHQEAHAHCETALALAPDSEDLLTELGLFELRDGDPTRGWIAVWLAARRNLLAERPGEDAHCDLKLPPDLSGKTVLLTADQGIGEELFFLRYVPRLKARGARVVYQPGAKVHALLRQRGIGVDEVLGPRAPRPPSDYRVFLSALPLALSRMDAGALPPRPAGVTGEDEASGRSGLSPARSRVFGASLPATLRLEPNPARLKYWRERLAELGAPPYVALTWRAGTVANADQIRRGASHPAKEAPAGTLCRLLGTLPGTLIALQREPRQGELEALSGESGCSIHDCSRANDDLEDVLALLALLDEYVCVSNTNTHLRACAGRTARVLVPWPAHWRWMAQGDASPWFPGFRTYRQDADGDWGAALARLGADLRSPGAA